MVWFRALNCCFAVGLCRLGFVAAIGFGFGGWLVVCFWCLVLCVFYGCFGNAVCVWGLSV